MSGVPQYQTPEGYYDQPFSWVFDGSSIKSSGSQALNNSLVIRAGYGDFILRRVAGIGNLAPSPAGQIQIKDVSGSYISSEPVNTSPGSDEIAIPRELLYPEKTNIRFDLYGIGASSSVAATAATLVPANVEPDINFGLLSQRGNNNNTGPFSFGGNVYVILFRGIGATGIARVYMSSNAGQTWTPQNTAGEPTTFPRTFSVIQVGSVLHFALMSSTGDVTVKTFDMSTNLWGASTVNAGIAGVVGNFIAVQSNGTRYVFISNSGTGNTLQFLTLTGGVWSAPTTIVTAAGGRVASLAFVYQDSGGTFNVFWTDTDGTSTTAVYKYTTVSSTGVVGVISTIATLPGTMNVYARNSVYSSTLNQYALPVGCGGSISGCTTLYVIVGNPTAGWTLTTVALGTTLPAGSSAIAVGAVSNTSGITVLWNAFNSTTGLVNQLYSALWTGGSWGAPALVYDEIANPPAIADPPSSLNQMFPNFTAGYTSTGAFAAFVEINVTPMGFSTAFPAFFVGQSSSTSSQILFQGVRRVKGKKPSIVPDYEFKPKYFEYISQQILTTANTVSVFQQITDFDFDLYEIRIVYSGSGLPKNICTILVYDAARAFISNIAMLDSFMNGTRTSLYRNGAFVPALAYPRRGAIRVDMTPLSTGLLPITATLHFVGSNRIPC